MNLLVLLLIALPACLAQFSIQGPSDGNRVAQGLRIEEGKGIEYTDQNEPQSGGFSIQGASDGSSQIQGASDDHSNFQIQGAHHGGADRYNFQGPVTGAYNIQGSTDGHSQSIIQGAYDGNSGSSKSLQYNDPSGLRVNWKSYDRPTRPEAQQEAQYSQAPIQRAAPQQRAHAQRQPQPAPQPEQIALQQARGLDSAPMQIKQLLQLQQQLPYINIIPEPFRYESLLAAQANQQQHQSQYQSDIQEQPVSEARRPTYRGKPSGPPRHRRQAQQQYRQGAAAGQQQQYSNVPQPPVESQIKYSPNLPPQLEQLLKFQQQTPYINSIPEPFRFNPEPYAQMQIEQFRSHYDDLLRQQPASPVVHTVEPAKAQPPVRRPHQESEHSRQRRQAQHRSHSQQPRPQPLPAEPAPQYSTNLPSSLQSLLKYQSQIPYNIIANQINYRPEKPYVPQPAQQPQQAQYQSQHAEYQPQQAEYEPQQAHYQPQQAQYQPQQAHYQPQQAQYQPQQAQYQPQQAQYQPQQAHYQPQQAQYQPQQPQYQTQYQPQQAQYQPQQAQYQGHGDVYQGQSSIYNQVSQIIQQQQADLGVRPVKEN
ncbi:uncharacterized protein LOC143424869 [Xylocopa sonorina]|uniref:uncharacterized protein LOC143424869 n=1 Tax=Xylocopa sonorina TaxID=1818115 RepID=UPI00403A92E9